jgi:uracil-DNA glycosylase
MLGFLPSRFLLDSSREVPVFQWKQRRCAISSSSRKLCEFLRSELTNAQAQRILALGRVPFAAVCQLFGITAPRTVEEFRKKIEWVKMGEKKVPFLGTYFPGNNRHQGFQSVIDDINRLLELTPGT